MQHRYHVAMLRHRDEFASLPGVWAKSRGSQKQSRSRKKAWQARKEKKKSIRGQTAWIHSVCVCVKCVGLFCSESQSVALNLDLWFDTGENQQEFW